MTTLPTCIYPDCQATRRTRGLCHGHYQIARRMVRDQIALEGDLVSRGLMLPKGEGTGPPCNGSLFKIERLELGTDVEARAKVSFRGREALGTVHRTLIQYHRVDPEKRAEQDIDNQIATLAELYGPVEVIWRTATPSHARNDALMAGDYSDAQAIKARS